MLLLNPLLFPQMQGTQSLVREKGWTTDQLTAKPKLTTSREAMQITNVKQAIILY